LAFASSEYAAKSWIKFDEIPTLQFPDVKVLQGTVTGLDTEALVVTIKESGRGRETRASYDFLIAASGLRWRWPAAPQSSVKQHYLHEMERHIQSLREADRDVVIIGGGAVGVEIAELKMTAPDLKVLLIHSRSKLLSSEPLPDDFKSMAFDAVKRSRRGSRR
jgi:NADH dehydrogenase FAD-containing subunit